MLQNVRYIAASVYLTWRSHGTRGQWSSVGVTTSATSRTHSTRHFKYLYVTLKYLYVIFKYLYVTLKYFYVILTYVYVTLKYLYVILKYLYVTLNYL